MVTYLSLTHFCEVHGPTSILCSQVIPSSCAQCYPEASYISPNDTPLSSHPEASPSLETRGLGRVSKHQQEPVTPPELGVSTSFTSCPTATNINPPDSPPASAPASAQRIEDHPWFVNGQGRTDTEKLNRFGGAEGDTCASCRLSVPEDVSKQLPPGAPGTLKQDGKGRNGSPVLRSREVVYSCSGTRFDHDDEVHDPRAHHSSPGSLNSSFSSDSSCHTHIVTYLSLRGPPNPADYSLLRRASIRTLSCELLPRGLSSGPLSFGDPVTGYTIAYVFRLPDPMARGKRRSYALVALAGKDAGRAFRASPVIWRMFGRIAASIVNAAERFQESEKRRDEGSTARRGSSASGRNYTPISSFLTGRTLDPDGQPRRAGQVRARNLAEIVGNEYIFAELHAQFVGLLQQLGGMFGGVRPSDPEDRSVSEEDDAYSPVQATGSSDRSAGRNSSHSRTRSEYDKSSVLLSAAPQPIPISHRRQVAA
ncbi:hypothetical protein AJ80_04428 [Polytolypa hystricis UAMH7299]|uniref:UDENN FLCN/SMCR8-type domain-containing protein n=1 Tax=Polytolypa hystricis (strain UAMH7299) TaxID=1447883 RepID=A0A2B7YBV2_POLH7|nr:hypothetical protein AJ80_04428 [Polytolypa hystricis UAMH7299]